MNRGNNRKRSNDSDSGSDSDSDLDSRNQQRNVMGSSPPGSSPNEIPSSPELEPFELEEPNRLDLEDEREEATARDLIGDDMEEDYQMRPEQDTYEAAGLDDSADQAEMDLAERRALERAMDERDMLQRGKRVSSSSHYELSDDEDGDDEDEDMMLNKGDHFLNSRRRRFSMEQQQLHQQQDEDLGGGEELTYEQLADIKADSLLEWVTNSQVSRTIAKEFKSFLLEYVDNKSKSVYGARIRLMGENNLESLDVTFDHLLETKAIIANFLIKCPDEILKIFDIVAMEVTELTFPKYSSICSEIHVRIIGMNEVTPLRDLREDKLNQLVNITGVVTRRTGIFPQLKYIKFDCLKCNTTLGPFYQDSNQEVHVQLCTNCESRGPFKLNSELTIYRNYQRVTIQESPGSIPAGRLPRHKEAILLWDLVDSVKPGEEIDLIGVYKNAFDGALNASNGFPVFATIIEANNIRRREGLVDSHNDDGNSSIYQWTLEEEKEFKRMSNDPLIIDKIIGSIAPSIYGHKYIKTAIASALFGGVPKDINGKHSIRGDINVLLLGDPGTAKSQILKYVEKTAQRAVFSTGQGASAVGLTASVRKDPITREWTLEGGALVLADKGVCMIDEFDKMNDQDRTSIHEAMEQQSISISKAGIVTTLQARCSVIAAANPIGGRYNGSFDLQRNVNLTEPILSRFDIVCVVRDLCNPENDERLAGFVVDSHMRSYAIGEEEDDDDDEGGSDDDRMGSDTDSDDDGETVYKSSRQRKLDRLRKEKEKEISPIPQSILVKYIYYARSKIYPKLNQMDEEKVSRVYADLRKESHRTGSFPITVRHLESILRIAEAHAKMRLSSYVSSYDLDRAIKVVVESFIGAQKSSIKKQLAKSFRKYILPSRS